MNAKKLVIPELFREAVAKFPQNTALQAKKDNQWQKLTYKDLETGSLKVAEFLAGRGLHKGEFVVLMLENRPEWAVIYLGIMYAGLACVPLDAQLTNSEVSNLILDSGAKTLFCSRQIFDNKITPDIRKILSRIIILDLKGAAGGDCVSFDEIEKKSLAGIALPEQEEDAVASLIYTSGTTANPKGVLLTHKNICSNFMSISELNLFCRDDNILCILPLHHSYSFMVNLLAPLLMGAAVTFSPAGLKPQELTEVMKQTDVTLLAAVPQFFSVIYNSISSRIKKTPFFIRPFSMPFIRLRVKKGFASLRFMTSGGARLDPNIARGLLKLGLKITEGYGITETSPVVAFNPLRRVKLGSVGKPVPGVQVKINNPDRAGIGEILIKGPNVMKGYFKQPEATSAVIQDGWFKSGDLGFIDKQGYVFITGREKEVIVLSSGKNIYPEELEGYFGQSPYIKEICILQKSEKKSGFNLDSLYAVVVPELDYFRQKNVVNIRAKIRWELENLSQKLPAYKHIMGFAVTNRELARTPLKKLKRYQIKEQYLKNIRGEPAAKEAVFSEEDRRLLETGVAKKIIRYFSQRLKKPVSLDSHMEIDLGIDSLTQVELAIGLEELFSVKLPDEFFVQVSTVKEIILKISELIGRTGTVPVEAAPKEWGQILREQPREQVMEKIRLNPNAFDYFLVFIFKNLILFVFRLLWLLRIKGRGNLPARGPYIITPNHASFLDAFVVFCSLPFAASLNTYFIGHNYIFEYPLVKWTIKLARLLPINPNTNLVDAMQAAAYLLSKGKIVCIFPQGERSVTEQVGEFKKGVGILIKEMDVTAVPAYIRGSHQSWPRKSLVPRLCRLKIIFGRPASAQELASQNKEPALDDYETIARGLREEVLKLSVAASFSLK